MNTYLLAFLAALAVSFHAVDTNADTPISTLEFRIAVNEPTDGYSEQTEPKKNEAIHVSSETVLTGNDIEKVSFFKDANGRPTVGLVLTDEGSERLYDATSKNTGKRLAILLDDKVVSAPNILNGVRKEVSITGRFDDSDLMQFFTAIVLRKPIAPQATRAGG